MPICANKLGANAILGLRQDAAEIVSGAMGVLAYGPERLWK